MSYGEHVCFHVIFSMTRSNTNGVWFGSSLVSIIMHSYPRKIYRQYKMKIQTLSFFSYASCNFYENSNLNPLDICEPLFDNDFRMRVYHAYVSNILCEFELEFSFTLCEVGIHMITQILPSFFLFYLLLRKSLIHIFYWIWVIIVSGFFITGVTSLLVLAVYFSLQALYI